MRGEAVSRAARSVATGIMSMTGLASSPGTAVLPM